MLVQRLSLGSLCYGGGFAELSSSLPLQQLSYRNVAVHGFQVAVVAQEVVSHILGYTLLNVSVGVLGGVGVVVPFVLAFLLLLNLLL